MYGLSGIQTSLAGQNIVERFSLNLADENDSLKLKNFKFRGKVDFCAKRKTIWKNTIGRKFALFIKPELQNRF